MRCACGSVSAEHAADSADRFLDVRARVEARQPEVALAARTKARARSADDLRLIEQAIEELPRRRATLRPQPDVRRVHAAEHGEAGSRQTLAEEARILHVERDLRRGLREP